MGRGRRRQDSFGPVPDPPTHKTCCYCRQEKPVKEMVRGRRSCLVCERKKCAAYRARNPGKGALYQRERRANGSRSRYDKARRRARQTPPPYRYLPLLTAAIDLEISPKRVLDYVDAGMIRAARYLCRVYVDPADVAAVQARRAMGDRSTGPRKYPRRRKHGPTEDIRRTPASPAA